MRRAPWFVGLATVSLLAGSAPAAAPALAGTPTCEGKQATLVGTDGRDELIGTSARDVIVARGGNDEVLARGGDDLVCSGLGADRVYGGAGADTLRGEADLRDEDAGGFFLRGDVLDGGGGNDELVGGHDGREGVRRLPDTVSYAEAPRGVVVDLSGQVGTATGHGTDTIRIQPGLGVHGSTYSDTIIGSGGPDRLDGRAGDDRVDGRAGSDQVFGESVQDGPGDDQVLGGPGDDLLGSYDGRDVVRGGAGDDFVEAYSDHPTAVSGEAGDDYVAQNLTRGSGADSNGGADRDVLVLYGASLEGAEPRIRVTVDLRSGTTTVGTEAPGAGSIGRFEEYRLVGDLRWRFHGTAYREGVWAITGGPLRAWTYGGDDWVRGSARDDLVDGGPGTDSAVGGPGHDTCRSIERGGC